MNYEELERDKKIWFIVWKMKRTPRDKWKDTFDTLSVGMNNIKEVKEEVWKRMQH